MLPHATFLGVSVRGSDSKVGVPSPAPLRSGIEPDDFPPSAGRESNPLAQVCPECRTGNQETAAPSQVTDTPGTTKSAAVIV